jgi:hypothetical protein
MERARASGDDDEEQMAFDALLYRLLVIGEAVKALPHELLDRESDVPWREVARLRDLLAHHYYRVDPRSSGGPSIPRSRTSRQPPGACSNFRLTASRPPSPTRERRQRPYRRRPVASR